jgi:predicted O-methyltransferase YrrM
MRKVGHWTPRYIYNRIRLMTWEHTHTDAPWLTPEAVRLLASALRPCDRGVEFGSGRSTIWFSERVGMLTSVEHDERWYTSVSKELESRKLTNVEYKLAPQDQLPGPGEKSEYARVALLFPEESIDFTLIDGLYRDSVAKLMLPRIKRGGLLIIDNVNWFLPSHSYSPNSRTPQLGPNGPGWKEVADELNGWRSLWTSSGITDTAIFLKP